LLFYSLFIFKKPAKLNKNNEMERVFLMKGCFLPVNKKNQ